MFTAKQLIDEVKSFANPKEAEGSSRYFKTGPGEYGEGDKFYGLTLTQVRGIVKKYWKDISLEELQKTIEWPFHEVRTVTLLILVDKYAKADDKTRKAIVDFYTKNIKYINNWDLVDISAHKIIGHYSYNNNDYSIIEKLSNSGHLWSERVSVISNWYIIKQGNFELIQKLAVKFMDHKHDLMHKAVGWMLRELGKQDDKILKKFLDANAAKLPRTALRYSLEKFDKETRQHYMKLK